MPTSPNSSPGLAERLGWAALRYPIAPTANRLPYMLGGLTFVSLTVLIVTGMLMDQFYNPDPLAAHDSVVYLITRVPLGSWVRGLHYWAATVVLISVASHLAWVLWRRSYFAPRELTWWSGVIMMILVFGLAFTGTVLRVDQEGTEALAHAVAGAKLVGPLGAALAPEFAQSTSLVTRLHNAHVSLLPLILVLLISLHFFLVRHHGIHAHEPKTSVFTVHLRKLTGVSLLLVSGLGLLALAFPPGIGYPGVEGMEMTKPFWPFLWIYTAENTIGIWGMLAAPALLFGFLFLVPVIDRKHQDVGGRPRWLFITMAGFLAIYLAALVYGFAAPMKQHIGM